MALTNWFRNGVVFFSGARLVGGNAAPPVRRDGYSLLLDATGIRFETGMVRKQIAVQFPAASIRAVEVLGVESRMTVTRLATLGVAGAGLRKNRTWIRVDAGTAEALFEVRVDERQVRAWVSQLPWARHLGHPPVPPDSPP